MLIFSRTVCVLAEVFWSFSLNSRFIMMMRWLLLFWIAVAGLCGAPAKDCMQFVQKIMTGKIDQDLREILPFVMYSGITANNPGQKYECQHTALGSKYNYFLVNWKNTTSTTDTFTGLCVPEVCNKEEIEKALQTMSVKNSKVYDYPSDAPADALFVVCAVFVGIWVGVLTLWSIVISCRSPVQNELIKKNEEKVPDDPERPINSLMSERTEKEDFKLFNFYEGYCRIFHRTNKKNFIAPIFFLAAFSVIAGKQFSLRQTIAANEAKSLRWFDSFGGVMFCNLEIAFNVIMFALGLKLAYSLYKLSSFHEIGRFFFDQLLTKWATLVLVTMAAYFLLCFTDEPLNQLWRNTAVSDCPSVIYQVWFVFRSLQFNGKACLPWFWVPEADIFMTILAAPFFIIYKTKKQLGFALFALIIVTSMIAGYAVLDSQSVLFEPYKLFNMSRDFTINYQTNAIVRIWPYFIGFIFGLIINESIEKEGHEEREHHNHGLVKLVRRNQKVQLGLHFAGFGLMLAMYLLIIPYLKVAEVGETRKDAYGYIIFAPFGFLIGLMLFLLPCFLQGENKLTVLVSRALNAGVWDSLDKMTLAFLGLGPVVIGFTTYSMQNSIYFDFQTILIYFLGDAVIIYILSLLIVAGIVSQLQFISKWVQSKVFKASSNYSVLVLED